MLTTLTTTTNDSAPSTGLEHSTAALGRATQLANLLNAVVVFTSFFGLLGLGILINAGEAFLKLRLRGDAPAMA